jgi:hypothetical protein
MQDPEIQGAFRLLLMVADDYEKRVLPVPLLHRPIYSIWTNAEISVAFQQCKTAPPSFVH